MAELISQNFKQLPIELRKLIVSQSPELLRIFSQIDKEYQDQFDIDYEFLLCSRPYSRKETQNYLRAQLPPIFSLYDIVTTGTFVGKIGIKLQESQYTLHTITIHFGLNVIVSSVEVEHNTVDINIAEIDVGGLDHLNIYRVLMNRLRCVRLNSNLARQQTLESFDNFYAIYKLSSDRTDDNDLAKIAAYFGILYVNSYSFNISPSPNLGLLNDFRNNIRAIKQENERLYTSIRQNILSL